MKKKRDWGEYDRRYIRRGEILFSLSFLDSWKEELERMNEGKRGRPYLYPESFIVFLKVLHDFVGFSYRLVVCFLRGVSGFIPVDIPSYSQIRRRAVEVEIPLSMSLRRVDGDFEIAVDSTGVGRRGEWIRQKWKKGMDKGSCCG